MFIGNALAVETQPITGHPGNQPVARAEANSRKRCNDWIDRKQSRRYSQQHDGRTDQYEHLVQYRYRIGHFARETAYYLATVERDMYPVRLIQSTSIDVNTEVGTRC